MEQRSETPIEKAVRLKGKGGQSALAADCKVTPQAVQQWVAAGRPPPNRCVAIEESVNGLVTRYELRPDIYGSPAPSADPTP